MVRKIQVCKDWEENILIWPLTSDGGYSVRSVYCMLVDAEILPLLSSSAPTSAGSVWKKIWKVRVRNKIRHFLWRAAKDSLPTKQNLKARHIPLGNVFYGCGDHTKSVFHCLRLCDQARLVWTSDPRFNFLVQTKCKSFFELLKVLFSGGSCFCITLFTTMAWSLWQRRNGVRECQPVWLLHEMGDKARTLVAKLWDVNPQEQCKPMRRPQVRRSPPPEYYYKANFDATFFKESVEMAEALVTRRVVLFAKDLSLFRVIIEGNCLWVIQALKCSGRCRTLFGHIIDETK